MDKEHKLTIEIFYTENGLQFEGYSYEAEDKLENRDICFLIASATKGILDEEDKQEINGE